MNDLRNEFTIKNLVKLNEESKGRTTYNILPKYGKGKFITYEIIKGLYLIYSEAKYIDKVENTTHKNFSDSVININYVLEGSIGIYKMNGRCTIANGGYSMYYAGIDAGFNGEFNKDERCQSITIFCYVEEIKESMKQILEVSKKKLEEYYNKIFQSKEVIIIKTNTLITCKVNEIFKYIISDNIELIRLRTMELLLNEMTNYNLINRKKYYTRDLTDKIERVKKLIDDRYYEDFTIKYLSERENISVSSLKTCFKDLYGNSIYAYKKQCRMEKSKQLLLKTDFKIYQIADQVGYLNPEKYTQAFKKAYGLTPTGYRKNIRSQY